MVISSCCIIVRSANSPFERAMFALALLCAAVLFYSIHVHIMPDTQRPIIRSGERILGSTDSFHAVFSVKPFLRDQAKSTATPVSLGLRAAEPNTLRFAATTSTS